MKDIINFISGNRKFILLIIIPIIIVFFAVAFFVKKPKPKYDALHNPIIESVQKEQAQQIKVLKLEITELEKDVDKKLKSSFELQVKNDNKIDAIYLKLRINKETNDKIKNNVRIDDIDADITDLRNRLPMQVD